MFILKGKLEDYGFEESLLLRHKNEKYFYYKNMDLWFIIEDDKILKFDTSAYGLQDYDLIIFSEIFYKLIKEGVIEYKENDDV